MGVQTRIGPPLEQIPDAPPTYRVQVEAVTRSGWVWHTPEGLELLSYPEAAAAAHRIWNSRKPKSGLGCVEIVEEGTDFHVCQYGEKRTRRRITAP